MSSRGFYDAFWAATSYQLAFASDTAARDRLPAIREVWGGLPRPGRVLDFGCGNGVLTRLMQSEGFARELVGVDVSTKAVSDAKARFAGEGLAFQAVASDEELARLGSFDAVVCSHVLEHLADPREALKRLMGLAPRLILEVPLERCAYQDAKAGLLRLCGKDRRRNPLGHCQFWDRDAFRKLLASCGLSVVREFQYACAPRSPYTAPWKRAVESSALKLLGLPLYGRLMSTHYAVLVER